MLYQLVCCHGDNSIVSRAGEIKTSTELGKAREALALAYAEATANKYLDEANFQEKILESLANAGYSVTLGSGISDTITDISLSLNELSVDVGESKEITITLEDDSSSNTPYYVLVDGKYHLLTIGEKSANIAENAIENINTNDSKVYSVQVESSAPTKAIATYDMTSKKIIVTGVEKSNENVTITIKYATADGENKFTPKTITTKVTQLVTTARARGDFVEYDVTYTDAYYPTYSYNKSNGWRILTVKNVENEKYNIEIIPTGIPARVYYYSQNPTINTNASYKWWGDLEDTHRVAAVNSYYKTSFSTTWNGSYSGYYAAYGLKFNFANIIFNQGIPQSWGSSNYNLAYFDTINGINNETAIDDKIIDTEEKVLDLFTEKKEDSIIANKVTGIRNIELADIRKNLGKATSISGYNSVILTGEEDSNSKGLFLLNNIKNNTTNGLSSYQYTNWNYWLASPNSYSQRNNRLCYIYNYGYYSVDTGTYRCAPCNYNCRSRFRI